MRAARSAFAIVGLELMRCAPASANRPAAIGARGHWSGARARSLLIRVGLLIALFGLVVFAIGQLVPGAADRLGTADPAWLGIAVALELLACLGYIVLFDAIFARSPYRLGFGRSARIALSELAGFVLAPGGVGGPAARLWMLRKDGMPWRAIGTRSVAHGAVFNVPYVAAALVFGLGLALHLTPGRASLVVALAPVALVCLSLLTVAAAMATSRTRWLRSPSPRRQRLRSILEIVPDGVRELPHLLRHPAAPLGAIGYWAGDCAVLWAAFHAFGSAPAVGIVVVAYMLGQVGNALPLPGGIGGVEPLMLGILTASGVGAAHAATAVISVSLGIQSTAGVVAVTSPRPLDSSGT
jgi:uncharacterized protein (TIRG00374 family)